MAPLVKPIFSKGYKAVHSRMQRLPKLTIGMLKTAAKRDAQGVIDLFKDGIENSTLRLRKLKPRTVDEKARKGYQLPGTPLYGVGLDDPKTYINMLEVRNVGNRQYEVLPKKGFHHQEPDDTRTPIKLKDLFDVHEYGTVIANGFGMGILIRIPARPALRYAYRLYMRLRAKADPALAVRVAIAKYIREGDVQALARIQKKMGLAK